MNEKSSSNFPTILIYVVIIAMFAGVFMLPRKQSELPEPADKAVSEVGAPTPVEAPATPLIIDDTSPGHLLDPTPDLPPTNDPDKEPFYHPLKEWMVKKPTPHRRGNPGRR